MNLNHLKESSLSHLARRGGFYLSVLVFVTILIVFMGELLLIPLTAWFDPAAVGTHFVHEVTFLSMILIAGVAKLVQLYRPARRVVAMQIALVIAIFTFLTTLVTSGFDPMLMVFLGPVAIAGALHPAGRALLTFQALTDGSINRMLLVLVAVAAIPVALYAVGELTLQATLSDEHAAFGHYAGMATYTLTMVTLVALAAIGEASHRLAASIAGIMAVLLAAGSLFQPTVSAISPTWATLAVLWAIAIVAVTHLPSLVSDRRMDDDDPDRDDIPATGMEQNPASR